MIAVFLFVFTTAYSNGTARPTSFILFPIAIPSMQFSIDSFKRWYIKLETSIGMCPTSRSLLHSPVAYLSFTMPLHECLLLLQVSLDVLLSNDL